MEMVMDATRVVVLAQVALLLAIVFSMAGKVRIKWRMDDPNAP